jgi:hypothetical protein
MKDILIFLVVMGLSLVPSLLKVVKKDLQKTDHVPKPKPKSDPYFPDADKEKKSVRPRARTSTSASQNDDYFTYETVPDERFSSDLTSLHDDLKEEVQAAADKQGVVQQEKEKPGLSLSESEIYKGIIYAEILKRKYI